MLARVDMRRRAGVVNLETLLDPTGVWLGASICAMAAGLVASLSRSGLTAGTAAAASLVWLSRGRLHGKDRSWLIAGLGLVALTGVAYANTGALMTRVGETVAVGMGGRREIWAVTTTMIGDFWLAGVGVGAYQRAMSIYQPPHVFSFNHAHNEYLQILSEGGLTLAIPVLVAVVAGARVVARRLRSDLSPVYWMRAGATSALVAIGVQSIWETGVIMPANAVLFALCAAVAAHRTGDPDVNSQRARGTGSCAPADA
jgi:O-antigen ligase